MSNRTQPSLTTIVLWLATILVARAATDAPPGAPKKDPAASPPTAEKFGVLLNESRALPGYNLINPSGKSTFLYDNEGRAVHSWTSEYSGGVAYLLDNGHLFRTAEATNRDQRFKGPAMGGRLQEFDWEGNLVWDLEYHSEKRLPHHDAIKLPNGNALLICWEMISEKEAVDQGRRPETVKESHLQPDCLVEIRPTGPKTGEIVWEWRSWDHLIQDRDRTKPNYGKVADHPERIDLNYLEREDDPAAQPVPVKTDATKGPAKDAPKKEEKRAPIDPDWMHVNAVAYNVDLDQVALSSPKFSEIWIIDHGTTTEEARGHTGGRWGKGGDLLYRWGNPKAYRNGTRLDQRLFFQHNIQWIPKGLCGEGHLLVFNNGSGRQPDEYSSVDELEPPIDKAGAYIRREHAPFGPDATLWNYTAPNKSEFFSWFISGAQRLPNGNTLINSGAQGVVFEVTPDKEIVWKFVNPFKNVPPPGDPAAKPFAVLAKDTRDALGMKDDQRKKLDEIDKELNVKLDEVLKPEQKKILNERGDIDLSKVPAGDYLAVFGQEKLKLTDDQTKALQAIQTEFNPKIATILTEDQKRMVEDRKKNLATVRAGTPRKPGNTLFRATRYALNHPAFEGKTLKPGKTLVEIQAEREQAQPKPDASLAKAKTDDGAK
jgi:hypothetical protein